jgi:hypothetical protein
MSGFTQQSRQYWHVHDPNHQAVRAEADTVSRIVKELERGGHPIEGRLVKDWLLKKKRAEAVARTYFYRTNGNPAGTCVSACESR